jgi:BlaI family transcriptional regulator, penicillinase repressor
MSALKLTQLELQIMEAFWNKGASSIREIQESFPESQRPAYTTVQTTVYRLEAKKAVRRVKKISNAHIFETIISRSDAQGSLIDGLLSLFGGATQPIMSHLAKTGKLSMEDLKEVRKILSKQTREDS